jgi:hypothetical protein
MTDLAGKLCPVEPMREYNTRHCSFPTGVTIQDNTPIHARRFNALVQRTILLEAFGLRTFNGKKNATENNG